MVRNLCSGEVLGTSFVPPGNVIETIAQGIRKSGTHVLWFGCDKLKEQFWVMGR